RRCSMRSVTRASTWRPVLASAAFTMRAWRSKLSSVLVPRSNPTRSSPRRTLPDGIGAAALMLALSGGMGALAAGSPGPQADAPALRAARGAGVGPELLLEFELRHDSEAPRALSLTIGSDYLDLVERGRETIYDFRLRRRLVLDRTARTFTSVALYSD